jgi:hypothetical protein
MFKNLSSKSLSLVFGILLLLALIFIYYDSTHEERTFKQDIIDIDTSKITAISIYPKAVNHKEVKLFKEGKYWRVRLENNRSFPAEESKVVNLINMLGGIKANSVAAQSESKWKEFKVDTSGTRVKVFEGSDNTLDMTIGKFSYQQQFRSMSSYVRVKGDKNIYEVNGFLDFAFNQKPDYFRNSTLVNDDYTRWKRLNFSYPDSSFQLSKDSSGYWTVNNIRVDSAKTINYLRTLSHLSGNGFIDNPDQSLLNKSVYTLTIESSAAGGITLSGFRNSNQFVIHSTQNPDAYFNGNANVLWKKIFLGRKSLIKKN